MSKPPVTAIILAAGLSSRMTGFKPLLPLSGVTAVERQIELFHSAGTDRVLVVCGYKADEMEPAVRAAGAEPVLNPDYEQGMFSSVRAGAAALGGEAHDFFILPVDVMLVRPDTVARLLAARKEYPGRILHPIFQGERGHPPLIPGAFAFDILRWSGERGLAGLLELHENLAHEVRVADEQMLFDVDTDKDYWRALERLEHYDIPSRAECMELLDITPNVNDMGRKHSKAVADVALQLARALNRSRDENTRLDLTLAEASGLLHDIAKGLPDHEREGGRMLDAMGYSRVAEVVAAHRDIDLADEAPLTEREVVFMADKLVQGDRLVRVRERYQAKIDQFADNPDAVAAIKGRLGRALKVMVRLDAEIGSPIEDIVRQPGA